MIEPSEVSHLVSQSLQERLPIAAASGDFASSRHLVRTKTGDFDDADRDTR